jgi:zinc transport system substrate-binding protein
MEENLMKKFLAVLTALIVMSLSFAGAALAADSTAEKLSVVATNFPAFDLARQVAGGSADVTMLLPPGAESHSYEPTPRDILAIQNADLFIYVGGENDTWVDGILSSFDHEVPVLRLIDCVNAVEEVTVEGMQPEEEEEEEASDEGEIEYDEHVWTSPKNAVAIEQAVAKELSTLDPANAATYQANSDAYTEKLTALDSAYADFFAGVANKTLIVGDRFPLRYFADEFGLTYYAAFPGCSNETEPSAATIAFLIDKVKSTGVTTVFYIEFSNHLVADSIAEQTGAKTALIHSCHNVSQADLDEGATYLSLMTKNLETLKGAMK